MKNILTILVAVVGLAACNNTKEKKQEATEPTLMEEVMALHDEVMPKMGRMMKVQKQLKLKADSIATNDEETAERLRSLASDIELANEAMMDWMRNFDPNFEGTEEEKQAYLEKKKKGIAKVAELMNGSLQTGEAELD